MPLDLMTRSQLCHAAGALQAQKTALQRRQKIITDELKDVQRAISALDAADIMVSDHAVVRWLERREGLDLEAVRARIAAAAKPHIGTTGTVVLGGGLVMLIDRNRVVTIMPEGEKPGHNGSGIAFGQPIPALPTSPPPPKPTR